MITGALKISIVSSTFLIAIGWTDRTVHIKNDLLEWLAEVLSQVGCIRISEDFNFGI